MIGFESLMARLQKIIKGKPTEVRELPQGVTKIGRGNSNFIVLASGASSKRHASIERHGANCVVTDLGSRNGTLVNDVRVVQQRLCDGDVIDFGGSRYVFLSEQEKESSFGSESNLVMHPLKVTPAVPEDFCPEESIRRSIVRSGDLIGTDELIVGPDIDGARILASLHVHDLPLASWNYIDSARKLSHVLRLTQAIRTFHEHQQVDDLLRVFLDLFSSASHALLALRYEPKGGCRIVAAVSRQDGEPIFLCHPLVRRSMADCEGLLVTDHWRNEPKVKPRLTELNRQSLLCMPIPSTNGSCYGVIQLQASDPQNPFTESDLERLAVLAHVMSTGVPGIRLSS